MRSRELAWSCSCHPDRRARNARKFLPSPGSGCCSSTKLPVPWHQGPARAAGQGDATAWPRPGTAAPPAPAHAAEASGPWGEPTAPPAQQEQVCRRGPHGQTAGSAHAQGHSKDRAGSAQCSAQTAGGRGWHCTAPGLGTSGGSAAALPPQHRQDRSHPAGAADPPGARDFPGQSLPGPSLTPLWLLWGLCPRGAKPRVGQDSCWESALLLPELGLLSVKMEKLRRIAGHRGQSWALLVAASARRDKGHRLEHRNV